MKQHAGDRLDAETERAARLFVARVSSQYEVVGAVVFGSRARRSHRPDSDTDIAILLRGKRGPFLGTKLALADIAFDVLLETGILIQPLPVWEDDWEDPDHAANPRLIRNIAREGIRL